MVLVTLALSVVEPSLQWSVLKAAGSSEYLIWERAVLFFLGTSCHSASSLLESESIGWICPLYCAQKQSTLGVDATLIIVLGAFFWLCASGLVITSFWADMTIFCIAYQFFGCFLW